MIRIIYKGGEQKKGEANLRVARAQNLHKEALEIQRTFSSAISGLIC